MGNTVASSVGFACALGVLCSSFAKPAIADGVISVKIGGILPSKSVSTLLDEPLFGATVGFVHDNGEALLFGVEADFIMSKTRIESGSGYGVTTGAIYGTVRSTDRVFLKVKIGPILSRADQESQGEFQLSFGAGIGARIVQALCLDLEISRVRNEYYFLTTGISWFF